MVDLDGVICTEERTFERPLAQPMPGAREALARLKAAGHGYRVYGPQLAGIPVTKKWLDDHGFVYDALEMGKPIADVWIDDRASALRLGQHADATWGMKLAAALQAGRSRCQVAAGRVPLPSSAPAALERALLDVTGVYGVGRRFGAGLTGAFSLATFSPDRLSRVSTRFDIGVSNTVLECHPKPDKTVTRST